MRIKGVNVKVGDLVLIRWEDHYGMNEGGWISTKKIKTDPLVCETVGWIVKMDRHRVATSQAHDGQFPDPYVQGAYSVCPVRMIESIRIIQKGKKWNLSV